MQSKPDISRSHLLFISFAAIFGSGWLFTPFYAAQIAGSASLIAWCVGALISTLIGITMAEVVVLFPRSGGLGPVAKETHGPALSLLVTLLYLVVFLILPAIEVRAVLQYLSSHFDFLMNSKNETSVFGYLFSFFCLILITSVGFFGTQLTLGLTRLVVILKMLAPLLICSAFLYVLTTAQSLDHHRLFTSEDSLFNFSWAHVFQAIATSGIIFSFNGFNQATLFAGETRTPQKTIPFAILGSLLLSAALYLLIQYVFLMALPPESIRQGWGALTFQGDHGPFIGLASILGLGWLLGVIYADAVISPLGTAFSYANAAPRLIVGLLESFGLRPISRATVALTLFLECFIYLFLPTLKAMIAMLVAAFVLCYTTAPASLLVLRKTHPGLHRPFKVRFSWIVSYLSMFFSNMMVFSCGWSAIQVLFFLVTALSVVYVAILLQRKHDLGKALKGTEWFLLQLLTLTGLSFAEYRGLLSFSQASVGVAFVSFLCLWIAIKRFPIPAPSGAGEGTLRLEPIGA